MNQKIPFLSQGVVDALRLLRVRHAFPAGWDPQIGRVGPQGGQSLGQWFRANVDRQCQGDVRRCKIEENMAVFIGLGGQGAEITFCSFQALITTTSLVRFYERGVGEGRYFRLDYDPKYLGEMFREPLPHLHVVPHGEPRILVPCHTSTNLVADMFDFLYRQFFYPQWSNWMHQVWDTERRRRNISLSQDPLWAIEDAFRRGKLSYLRTAEKYLDWLRAALHEHKDAAFPLRISSSDHTLTAYW